MNAQFLLLVRVTRSLEKRVAFCEPQPTHPLGGILIDTFEDPLAWSLRAIELIIYELRSRRHNQSVQDDHTTN
jgi:hypothetical protein